MNEAMQILVVDDEPHICEVIRLYLEHSNFNPKIVHRGGEALDLIQQEAPDLILLDIMMPDMSGFEVCQRIRGLKPPLSRIPVILLTAKGESMDKLRGFNMGIDDYIVKPFDPNELVARIKAVLRRSVSETFDAAHENSGPRPRNLNFGTLHINLDQYKVTINGNRVDLTPKEVELLYFFASNPKRVYSREDLLGHVWNFDFNGGTRTVDAHVKNLRKKLGQHEQWSIETLWGIGYYFEVADNEK